MWSMKSSCPIVGSPGCNAQPTCAIQCAIQQAKYTRAGFSSLWRMSRPYTELSCDFKLVLELVFCHVIVIRGYYRII